MRVPTLSAPSTDQTPHEDYNPRRSVDGSQSSSDRQPHQDSQHRLIEVHKPKDPVPILNTSAGVMFICLALTGVFDQFFGPGNPATYAPELLSPVWGLALGATTLADYYRRRGRCSYCGSL
jgi:hypothetical protein